ncbi:MAG: hypothetical protein Q4A05_04215 [Ruminococcus sp.]|nr:hypothetical protein [Ruminococcus sp.]
MKHTKKTALTAALLTAAGCLVSCNGEPSSLQTEYGPPPVYEPATEEIQDVYGPPPFEEEDTTMVTTTIDILPDETTTVSESEETSTKPVDMQLVYGPPNAIDD